MPKAHQYFSLIILLTVIFAGCKTQRPITSSNQSQQVVDTLIVIDSIAADSIPSTDIFQTVDSADSIPMNELAADTIAQDTISVVPIEPSRKDTILITGVGDIMLGTNFPEKYYLPPNEGREMLADVQHVFEDADIVFGNLEGVILNSGGTQKKCNNPKACYLFRSPEYMGERLNEAGFNLMSVANNHAGDFGTEGRLNTGKVLDSLDIAYAGNMDRPWVIIEKEGTTYGFAAFAPNKGTPSINHISAAKNTIMHLDSLCDMVIVSLHGGAEGSKHSSIPRTHEYYYGEDRGDVYHFSHAMIDAGADIIFGHGPHIPRAIEVYKKRFIAYSLGNFATYGRFNLRGDNGLAPIAKIAVNSKGEFLTGQIVSCIQLGRGVPVLDPTHRAAARIWELTKKDIPEVEISIDESGFISYLHN